MANITRIKASDNRAKTPKAEPEVVKTTKKPEKKAEVKPEKVKKSPSPKKAEKPAKEMPKALAIITWPFRMIAKPFIAFGRYVKASWQELRQVRWPSRGATWKMTLAALIYTALFIGIIMLLDVFFTWLFNLILV